jgi:hypothetical protein
MDLSAKRLSIGQQMIKGSIDPGTIVWCVKVPRSISPGFKPHKEECVLTLVVSNLDDVDSYIILNEKVVLRCRCWFYPLDTFSLEEYD